MDVSEQPGADLEPQAAASARIASYVRDLILRDDLKPGDRIRQEEIAERTGASRLPVREALRILEAEGLVTHERHKGASVPSLSMHELDVVYRMRERLEPVALAESLPQLTAADLTRLAGIQEQIEANTDLGRFIELDREFHLGSYAGLPHRATERDRHPTVELHPALPTRLRRHRRPATDVGRELRTPTPTRCPGAPQLH